jgi:hypothetical protein
MSGEPTERVGGDGAGPPNESCDEARLARHARLADDIRERLHPVCADWDPRRFEALVHRIARMKARWADTP